MTMNKSFISTLVMSGLLTTSVFAESASNFKKTEDAIKYRQAGFSLIYHNFADMGAMVKGKKPFDTNVFAARAENVAALAYLPLEGFVENSDKGNTDAKSEIWQDKADFESKMKQFQIDSTQLAQIAKSGDQAAMKSAFIITAKNCKSCHNSYKKD